MLKGTQIWLSAESQEQLSCLARPGEPPRETLRRLLELVSVPDEAAKHGIRYDRIQEAMTSE